MSTLDAAWRELEMDALASDGRISDADVKNAIKRNRPHIEAAIRAEAHAAGRAEALREVERLRDEARERIAVTDHVESRVRLSVRERAFDQALAVLRESKPEAGVEG